MSLTRTAHHEAGHAVAALFYGQTVERVTIVPTPDEGLAGHSQDLYADDARWTTDEAGRTVEEPEASAYKARILGLYAGRAAEALLSGERDARRAFHGLAGDGRDRRQAAERIATLWLGFGERRRRARRYRRLALWFVWRYRSRVARLAEALLRIGALHDTEVELAVDEGAESVAAYRTQWAGHDGGRWAEWAAAVARLRAEESKSGAERA